jgi:hypothetical protein
MDPTNKVNEKSTNLVNPVSETKVSEPQQVSPVNPPLSEPVADGEPQRVVYPNKETGHFEANSWVSHNELKMANLELKNTREVSQELFPGKSKELTSESVGKVVKNEIEVNVKPELIEALEPCQTFSNVELEIVNRVEPKQEKK